MFYSWILLETEVHVNIVSVYIWTCVSILWVQIEVFIVADKWNISVLAIVGDDGWVRRLPINIILNNNTSYVSGIKW